MIRTMYRLFDEKDGLPHTLFHGVNGRRLLPLDTWIDAEVKTVRDGAKEKATAYTSGFHVFETLEDVVKFLGRFKRLEQRVICPVQIDDEASIWDKEHSPAPVKLARRMRISSKQWAERLPAKKQKRSQDGS